MKAVLMSSYINNKLTIEKDGHIISKNEDCTACEDIDKPYLCVIDNCGFRFYDPEELKEHLNGHKLI